jgi:hypothetical protein
MNGEYAKWVEQKLTTEDMDKLPKVIKPLTQDQILKILAQNKWNTGDNDDLADIVDLIRSIEKAHNIT